MATTLPHVRADLAAAEEALAEVQQRLIEALDSRSVRMAELGALETEVEEATRRRDDLRSTSEFIIKRERERGEAAEGRFTSALYLSQRDPSFTYEDVAIMAGEAQQRNEGYGVTGALYVFDEWFASYIEGAERDVEKLVRNLKRDARHSLFRVVARDIFANTGRRLFPKDPLRVVWLREGPSKGGKPWLAVARYLQNQLNFAHFEPTPPRPAKGVGSRSDRWFLIGVYPSSRYTDHQARQLDSPEALAKSLSEVRCATRAVVERSAGASVISPHNTHLLCAVPASAQADTVLVTAISIREAILKAEPAYFPHIAVLLTTDPADAVVIVDGLTSVVGPATRRLRLLANVAQQEDKPVMLDTAASDDLQDRSSAASAGWFDFDGKATECFVPSEFTGESPLATWGAFVDHQLRTRIKQQKRRQSFAGGSSAVRSSSMGGGSSGSALGITDAGSSSFEMGSRDASLDLHRRPSEAFSHVNSVIEPGSIMTADKYAHGPVAGAVSEAELRAEFDRIGPRAGDDTVSMAQLQTAIYEIDYMGAPPPVQELRQSLINLGAIEPPRPPRRDAAGNPVAAGSDDDDDHNDEETGSRGGRAEAEARVSFDHFAVLWCRALIR